MLTFVTLATLTVSLTTTTPQTARATPSGTIVAHRSRLPHGYERRDIRSAELYASRARRRYASYIRLRLLELREAGLSRAAAVIERRLPVETLVPPLHR